MSRRHTWSFSRSNASRRANFRMKYLKITDYLDTVKIAKTDNIWTADPSNYGKVKLYTPLATSAKEQLFMPLNTNIYPITARSPGLAKLNYYSILYDFYMIDSVVIQYIPGVSVTTPGFLTFYYEPNPTFSPLITEGGKRPSNENFDWTAYAARQKYGVTFPVWQPHTMVIRPKKYWMRTVPNELGTNAAPFQTSSYASDPLVDYGSFYWHTDQTASSADWETYGIINIYLSVKFRDFSFGRFKNEGTTTINTANNVLYYTNSESVYNYLKDNKDFLQHLLDNNMTWDQFINAPSDVQGSLVGNAIGSYKIVNSKNNDL